ncbi:hypothetical protein OsI_28245 [Oryza sativa Indica Group]|uniref:MATH domain-containing protein n=1 Tax=Oryza sativa subsp. indica TaxID=39946 RepID=A2YSD9_ORYSI|nr:hypothetical protein OsI_28245 [Oryza sativa Indica Group]
MSLAAAGRIVRTASAIVSRPSTTSHVLRVDGYSHLVYHGHDWGLKDFIAREELERSEYLRDDCFAVQCEVDVTAVRKCHDHPVFISQNIYENRVSDAT